MYFEIMTNPFKTRCSPDQSQTVTDVVLFLLRQTLGFRESTESIMFLFFKYFYSCMAVLSEVHTQRRIQGVGYWGLGPSHPPESKECKQTMYIILKILVKAF